MSETRERERERGVGGKGAVGERDKIIPFTQG